MRIRYVGTAGRRIVSGYSWTHEQPVAEVEEAGLIAELLTHPDTGTGVFVVADDDPLAQAAGLEKAAELALEGITTVEAWREQTAKAGPKFFQEVLGD